MADVYSVMLDVRAPTGTDLEQVLVEALREWIGDRLPRESSFLSANRPSTVRTDDGSIFRWEPFTHGNQFLHEFTWRHADQSLPDIAWSTQVSAIAYGGVTRLAVRVANTGPDYPSRDALLTTRPRLLPLLAARIALHRRTTPLRNEARSLQRSVIPDFVRYELFDPSREVPILLLTPKEDGSFVVPPGQLATEFMSEAEVCVIEEATGTFELTSAVGRKELSCFHGAMRVFLPGFNRNADPHRHPLLLAKQASDRQERLRLSHFLALLTTRSFRNDPAIPQLRDERAVAQNQRHTELESQLALLKGLDTDAKTWRDLAVAYAEHNSQLQQSVTDLETRLGDSERSRKALLFHLQEVRRVRGLETDDALPLFEPHSLSEAVQQAQFLHGEHLNVLASAITAADDSPYRTPSDAAKALATLAELSAASRDTPFGKNLKDVFRERGLDYRGGISPTTPSRMRDQHVIEADGERFECFEHLCFGSTFDPVDCLRIYFTTKRDSAGRWVVGHVGRHLDTLSTN